MSLGQVVYIRELADAGHIPLMYDRLCLWIELDEIRHIRMLVPECDE